MVSRWHDLDRGAGGTGYRWPASLAGAYSSLGCVGASCRTGSGQFVTFSASFVAAQEW